MDITSRLFRFQQQDDAAVFVLNLSRMSEEENLEQLDRDWRVLIEKLKLQTVVIDLSSVEYMTSTAIGRLISLHRQMIRQQGQLFLCSLRKAVMETLQTSHLLNYFRVTDTPDAALAQSQISSST
ncbi:MAG TPA: STAS domain-containing protein [Planctomicrobium sp.]|nr:STAS domain-containing protein [Planctomicrobium sp.]